MTHFSRVPVSVWADDRLNLRHIKVLGAILAFAGKDGRAHPTHRQISEICGIREKDIPTFTAQLCRLGWLEKFGNGGRSSPADYVVKTTPNLGVDNTAETTHKSRVVKTTPNLGVDTCAENHPQFEEKPPPNRGKNHPQIAEKTTPNLGVRIHQTITRPSPDHSPDQLQHPVENDAEIHPISAAKKSSRLTPEMQSACKGVWEAYSTAYLIRYGTEPVKNAKVAGQVVQFVKRIGMEEARYVASHYLTSSARWYVTVAHSTDAMLKDAEKLRMEWATNRRITAESARQADATQSNFTAAEQAKAMLAARRAEP